MTDFTVQSDIIGACQFLFAAMVLPTLFNEHAAVPRLTSGLRHSVFSSSRGPSSPWVLCGSPSWALLPQRPRGLPSSSSGR